jgi:hypothetical protein
MLALIAGLFCTSGCNTVLSQHHDFASPTPQSAAPQPAHDTWQAPTASPPGQPTPQGSREAAEAWQEYEDEALSIRMPGDWRAEPPEAVDTALSTLQRNNPDLGGFLQGAGSATGLAFSASGSAGSMQGFADNLTIRRTALDGQDQEELPGIAATVAAQYRQLGFEDVDTTTGLEIGGLPAALVAYRFSASQEDGDPIALGGLQVLVAAPADLWILTYTAQDDQFAALRTVFEESARSFRVRKSSSRLVE